LEPASGSVKYRDGGKTVKDRSVCHFVTLSVNWWSTSRKRPAFAKAAAGETRWHHEQRLVLVPI